MRGFVKNILIVATAFPIALGATYFCYPYMNPAKEEKKQKSPLTQFTTNMMSSYDIQDAKIVITKTNDTSTSQSVDSVLTKFGYEFTSQDSLEIDLNAKFGLASLTAQGDMKAYFNGSNIMDLDFIYDGDKIFVGLDSGNFSKKIKVSVSSLTDIFTLIPVDGMSSLFGDMDMSELSNILTTMKDVSDQYDDEYPYHFTLPLPFLHDSNGEEIVLLFNADADIKPVGIKLSNPISIEGYSLSVDLGGLQTMASDYKVETPSNEDSVSYEDYDNVLNISSIIPNLMELVNSKKFEVSFNAELYNDSVKEFNSNGLIQIDANSNNYGVSLAVIDATTENSNALSVSGVYKNNTTYIDFANGVLKGKVTKVGIDNLVNLIEDYLGKSLNDYVLDVINDISKDETINSILQNINSLEKIDDLLNITADENNLYITISTQTLGYDYGLISLSISHSDNKLNAIKVSGIKFQTYTLNLTLNVNELTAISVPNEEQYSTLDSLTNFGTIIPQLINEKQYGFGANLAITDSSSKTTTITLDGQLDLINKETYGVVNIKDSSDINHFIKFDVLNNNDLYLLYDNKDRLNDEYSTKVSFELSSIDEMYSMIQDFMNYLNEGSGDAVANASSSITDLLNNPAILTIIREKLFTLSSDNLKIELEDLSTPNSFGATSLLKININGAYLGLNEGNIALTVGYTSSELKYIELNDLDISGTKISGCITLDKFSASKASSSDYRLDTNDTYYSISDIKVLLYLGINTAKASQYKNYHITGKLDISILGIDLNIPYELWVKNNNKNIEVIMTLTIKASYFKVGGILLFDSLYRYDRNVTIYFKDKYLYIDRTEGNNGSTNYKFKINTSDIFSSDNPTVNLVEVITTNVATFSGMVKNAITKSIKKSQAVTDPIKYEQILKEFYVNSETSKIWISLNFAELAKNEDMTRLDIEINYNKDSNGNYLLNDMYVYMTASVTIDIDINFYLKLDQENLNSDYSPLFMNMYDYIENCKDVPSSLFTPYN